MFNPHDNQPQSEAEFLENDEQKSGTSRFYKAAGNISEFGLYFSAELALALLSRLIPGMLIAYAALLGLTAGYIALALGRDKRESAVIGLAITVSTIAGFWDAVASIVAVINPLLLISIPTLLVCIATLWRVRK
ncbi:MULTISPECIES: hypothetical protein [Cyanophyceae]|uniref:hypothetical protein n=1 Tax=Cyanophyceae TaxID=3028117 RepID=UPI001686DD37|nr:hypothetical protein [Trichocoleus sp. FACHB-832]MBD1908342.1 hypothetical protein [Trichocoleus sp. FACHB-832]